MGYRRKPLDILLTQLGLPLTPLEHKMWAPWQSLIPTSLPWSRQSPGQKLPVAPPPYPFSPQPSSALERPEEEVLVKDPEGERRIEGFQGGVAIDCQLITPGLSST